MPNRLWTTIRRSTLARVSGATVIAQFIAVTGSVAVAKIYDPELFGTYATWLAVLAVTSLVCTGSLETSLVLDTDHDRRRSATLVTATAVVGSFLIVILLSGARLAFATPARQLTLPLLGLAVACGFLTSIGTTWQSWASASGEFATLNRQRMLRAVSIACFTVAAGLFGRSISQLTIGYLIGISISAAAWTHQVGAGRADLPSRKTIWSYWIKRGRFLRLVLPGVLVSVVTSNLLIVVIFSRFGGEAAGFLALSLRVLSTPSSLLGLSVRDVFRRQASVAVRERGECRPEYLRSLKLLAAMSACLCAAVLLLGSIAFELVFGSKWALSSDISIWMLPMVALSLMASPLSNIVYIVGKENWDLYWQVIVGILTTTSLFMFSDLRTTLLAYSITYSVMYAIYIAMAYVLSAPQNRVAT